MSKLVPNKRELIKLLPQLGMGEEPFDANEEMLAEPLAEMLSALEAEDKAGYVQKRREFAGILQNVADDNVPGSQLRDIIKKVEALVVKVSKGLKPHPGIQKNLRKLDQNSTEPVTVMSAMNAGQQKDYFSRALKTIAEYHAAGDPARGEKNLKTLSKDVEGSLMYHKYDLKALRKMAAGIYRKLVFDEVDAPRVNLEMVGKLDWRKFFKAYGVTHAKQLEPTLKTLAKILVKEGHSSRKPLTEAKKVFVVLKGESNVGRFKNGEHLLGAVTDALLKNGKAAKAITENAARKLIAS